MGLVSTVLSILSLSLRSNQNITLIIIRGIVSTLAYGLGFQCPLLLIQASRGIFGGGRGRINLATCVSMKLFKEVGGQVWLNHHGTRLFPLPNPEKTIITERANWTYDDTMDIEGDDEGGVGGNIEGNNGGAPQPVASALEEP